jgi:uncharacterized membrane protein (TIGR02234 family)
VTGIVVSSADRARAAALDAQARALSGPADHASLTAWFVLAGAASLVCAGCLVVAALQAGRWPEMSRRYDAPAGRGRSTTSPEGTSPTAPQDAQQAWRALDEGRDPTV